MKKKFFVPVIALAVLINVSLLSFEKDSKSSFSLQGLFNINSAAAEHTATYTCYDESYSTTKTGLYLYQKRVCDAPNCGKVYIRWEPTWDTGSCTITIE